MNRIVERWTGRSAVTLAAALRMSLEEFAEKLGASARTVGYWDQRPETVPTVALQAALDTFYDEAPDSARARFWALLDEGNPQPSAVLSGSLDTGTVLLAAAHESAADAALRATGLSSDSLDDLRDQVVRVARSYASRPPLEVFGVARQVRDLVVRLAERCRRPRDLADLYVVCGQANALMSSIAFDLGHWDAAVTLAQSASTYADEAGHASLLAWTLGLRATLANWGHQPSVALRHAERALSAAPAGAPRVRLLHIASRSHALRGDAESAAAVLAQAQADREIAALRPDELHDEVRGEFRFDDARAAACAGAAWLGLGDGVEAERYTLRALEHYEALPAEVRPFSPVNGARIDTAAARLLQHDFAGAQDALLPVLSLEPDKRNAALSGRLRSFSQSLSVPTWRGDSAGKQLVDDIAKWLADTAARPLPAPEVY